MLGLALGACEGGAGDADAGTDAEVVTDAGALHPERYPADPTVWSAEACAADQAGAWAPTLPAECASGRLCIDGSGRTYRDGVPFVVRGVYHGGREVERLLVDCPAGAPCRATQPADHAAYVRTLADAGFDLILEDRALLSPALLAAIDAEPRVGIGHLLFDDVFTPEGHDRLVTSIESAAADPSVLMFFGPDEPDLNRTWPMAAGIARLLRGASPELDALLARAPYAPPSGAYLPADEPAHDPNGLPFASAVVIDDAGLAIATDLYDLRVPVTYPYQEAYSRADAGEWSVERISRHDDPAAPSTPVLQMVEIDALGLIRPSPDQIRALVVSSIVHGADGAFYFKVAGDDPPSAGRDGFFAADDAAGWAAYADAHALWDALVPVIYSDATVERGTHDVLHWRRYVRGDRRVVLIANPTPFPRAIDLDAILARSDREYVREWRGCAPFTTRALEVPGYATYALEVVPAGADVPGDPGDPLAAIVPPRPLPETPAPLGGHWETSDPLAAGRSSHAAVAADGAIALLGGYRGSLDATASVERYPDGGGALADLPVRVASAAAMRASDGAMVVAGGVPRFPIDAPVVPLADCQRLAGGAWSACAALGNGPTAAAAHASYLDALYLFGGIVRFDPTGGNLGTRVVQRYDASRDAWSAETELPSLRAGSALAIADGVAYVVGGLGESGLARDVLAYDLHARAWIEGAVDPLPTPRAALACAAQSGFVYCVGGYDAAGTSLAVVERLELATGAWTALDPLPEPLSDTVAVVHEGALHVLGGLDAAFSDSSRVYVMR